METPSWKALQWENSQAEAPWGNQRGNWRGARIGGLQGRGELAGRPTLGPHDWIRDFWGPLWLPYWEWTPLWDKREAAAAETRSRVLDLLACSCIGICGLC